MSAEVKHSFEEFFFLSDRDNSLLASDSRDPLGFEILWVTFGHSVVPHVNTQSIGARNFIAAAVMQWLVDEWLKQHAGDLERLRSELSRSECLLVVDSLLVYSVIACGEDEARLYGRTRAKKRFAAGEPLVGPSPERQLLTGQLRAGNLGL